MKKKDQRMPEYSVKKPATSSDSASGRSKGARLTSARAATKNRMARRQDEGVLEHEPAQAEPVGLQGAGLAQVEGAGDYQGNDQGDAEGNLVGDDLSSLAHGAVERPLRVRGPTRHHDADCREGRHAEDEEDAQIDVGEEPGPAIAAWPRRLRRSHPAPTMGAIMNSTRSALSGTMSSFMNSLRPSAMLCAQPCQPPAYIGPYRHWMWPETLRSTQGRDRGRAAR